MRLTLMLIVILSGFQVSYGQERDSKVSDIIDRLNLVDNQRAFLIDHHLTPLKHEASEENKAKLIELEDLLTDDEIEKRIIQAFDEVFTKQEIDDLYIFVKTSAFDKLIGSPLFYDVIEWQFEDVLREFDRISGRLSEKQRYSTGYDFTPIPTEKADGFYAVVHQGEGEGSTTVELTDVLSVKKEHIAEVKKDTDYYGAAIIEITFDQEGADLFYKLTKNQIGKPVAIVVDKYIVSMPYVNMPIDGGKASITGNFSEEEVERMMKALGSK